MDLTSLISKVKNKMAKSFKDRLRVPTEHSLDIPRRNMPQIKKKHLEKYMKWLKKQGVEIKETKLDIKKLKPTQKDFNLNKVVETMNTRQDKLKKPILVSKDNYIIDGHHKWLAHLNLDSEKIPALKANMNAKDLLAKSREFSKVHYKDVEENVYKEIDPKQKYADIIAKIKRKLAIDQSESKKIYEKIKDLPKGEKRDEALQKEVNDRGLDKEEINELMYDLTHTLKMINIQKPKVEKKKINHEEIGQELYENLEDKLFDVELSGYYSEGNEHDVELTVDKLEVDFDKIYEAANKKLKGALPTNLTEEDKKKIVEELDGGEIVDFIVEDVALDMWYDEDHSREVERDIEISSIDLKDPKYDKGKIYFSTTRARVSGSVK